MKMNSLIRRLLSLIVGVILISMSIVFPEASDARPSIEPYQFQTNEPNGDNFETLLAAADDLIQAEAYLDAIEQLQAAIEIAEANADQGGLVDAYGRLATAQRRAEEYADAAFTLEELLALQKSLGDVGGIPDTLALIGSVYEIQGMPVEALDYYDQAIKNARDIGNTNLLFAVINAEADLLYSTGNAEAALASYENALTFAQESDDVAKELNIVKLIGNLHRDNGSFDASNEMFEIAVELIEEQDLEDLDRAELLALIGANYADLGETDEALQAYGEAHSIAKKQGSNELAYAVLLAESELHQDLGKQDAALETYEAALELAEASDDLPAQVDILVSIGHFHRDNHDYEASNDALQQAIELANKREADIPGSAEWIALVGANYSDLDEYRDALTHFADAIEVAKDEDNIALALAVQRAEGELHQEIGDIDAALTSYTATVELAQEHGLVDDKVVALTIIGNLYRSQKEYAASSVALREALTLSRKHSSDGANEAELLALLGANQAELGETADAYQYYADALVAAEDEKNDNLAFAVLRAQGELQSDEGKVQAAADSFEAARAIALKTADTAKEIEILRLTGNMYRNTKRYQASNIALADLLALQEEMGDINGLAQTMALIGSNETLLGNNRAALSALRDAALTAQKADDSDLLRAILGATGDLYVDMGLTASAIETFREAIDLDDTEIDDTISLLDKIALAYSSAGSLASANTVYNEKLTLQQKLGDDAGSAETIAQIGANTASLGNISLALDYYERAVTAALSVGDLAFAATVLDAQGGLLTNLKRYEEAITAYRLAADTWQRARDMKRKTSSLKSLASTAAIANDHDQALTVYDEALALIEQNSRYGDLVDTQIAKGNVYWLMKRQGEAHDLYASALQTARTKNDVDAEIQALYSIALAHSRVRHYEEALKTYQKILTLAEQTQDEAIETKVRQEIWTIYIITRQYEQALEIPNVPIGILSPIDGAVVSGSLSVDGLAHGSDFHKWQLDLLIDGDENEATFLGLSDDQVWWLNGRQWGELLTMDTNAFPNGDHVLRLRIVQRSGNYDEHITNIRIQN